MNDIKVKLIRKICLIANEQLLNDINQFIVLKINEYARNAILIDNTKFEVGDIVHVIHPGEVYDSYDVMFTELNFKNQRHNDLPHDYQNYEWKVIMPPVSHPNNNDSLIPIGTTEGHQVLISHEGIRKI